MRTAPWLLLVTFLAARALCAADAPDPAKLLLGCWKNEQNARFYMLFEDRKCFMGLDGAVNVFRVKYDTGKVFLYEWGRKVECPAELKENVLTLSFGEKKESFKKIEKTPDFLKPKALTLGEAKALDAGKLQELKEELGNRKTLDQAVRSGGERTQESMKDMHKVDTENTKYLKDLIEEIGWIDAVRFGAEASNSAFLLVQHSGDLPLMLAALPEIEKDVKAKRLDGQPYALLYDRLQLMLGEKQKFGTQVGSNEKGEAVVLPLESKEKVEQFRKEIGIFPLTQYLAYFKDQTGGKDVGFMEEE